MGSPITSWDDAGAYFTFADSPAVISLFLLGAVVLCVGAILIGYVHEQKAFKEFE